MSEGEVGAVEFCIARNVERPDPALLEALRAEGQRTILFASPRTLGASVAMDFTLKPLRPSMHLFGPALTVQLSQPDHLMTMYAITLAQPGDVLVIDAGERTDVSVWGGSMTRSALNRHLGGAVIDGVVSDAGTLADSNLPIFARGASPAWAGWEQPGSINVPVRCGGRTVEPGDLLVGDADGVVVVPRARLPEALERIRALTADFPVWRDGLGAGQTFFEVLDLQERLVGLNIRGTTRSAGASAYREKT